METVSSSHLEGSKGSTGGLKEAIVEVKGEGAYDLFRWESGVHRVQRVPATETQGRVHTSTISVIVSVYCRLSRNMGTRRSNLLSDRSYRPRTLRKTGILN